MAKKKIGNEFSTTKQPVPYDIYIEGEGRYTTTLSQLRRISNDKTPLDSPYSSFYSNVIDMIDGENEHGPIEYVSYDKKTNSLKIVHTDGYVDTVKLPKDEDTYLDKVKMNKNDDAVFTMNDGNKLTLPISDKYYNKEEVDDKHKWLEF